MAKSRSQSEVINQINQYLEWNNLPFQLGTKGVCNGLSSVYIKYTLEGRQDEFFEILDGIVRKKAYSEIDHRVDQLVVEILLSQNPELFNQKLSQTSSTQALQSLKPAFCLGLTTSDQNWSKIFHSLKLRDGEVMLVQSINHTVALSKKNGIYQIYDPNYSSGFKEFSNEDELIQELHENVFYYDKGLLGISIQITTPDTRSFPKVEDIYSAYLTKETVNDVAIEGKKSIDTLTQAVHLNDAGAVRQLINLEAKDKDLLSIVIKAVQNNSCDALNVLLQEISQETLSDIPTFFIVAAKYGRKEVFDVLLENPTCRKVFDLIITKPIHADKMIGHASKGGNPELLEQIIKVYYPNTEDNKIAADLAQLIVNSKSKIIDSAIESGSIDCVNLLMKIIAQGKQALTEEARFSYFIKGIQKNQPRIVSLFIEELPKEQLATMKMSASAVRKADLSILKQLQEKGFVFSEIAKGIMDKKEHRSVGILLTIGIMLSKFTDYIKETFLKTESVKQDIEKFKQFKSAQRALREEATPSVSSDDQPKPSLVLQ